VILYEKDLPDGRQVCVMLMIFNFRITIGDDLTVFDGWCYPQDLGKEFVISAAESWDGEGDPPDGWIKQISTGRRRKNGDPNQEYVQK
jgi:hypothetical protein